MGQWEVISTTTTAVSSEYVAATNAAQDDPAKVLRTPDRVGASPARLPPNGETLADFSPLGDLGSSQGLNKAVGQLLAPGVSGGHLGNSVDLTTGNSKDSPIPLDTPSPLAPQPKQARRE